MTGATGGLGLALVEALAAQGYAVRATGRRLAPAKRLLAAGAQVLPADLRRPEAVNDLVQDVDVVFHAAALSSPWGRYPEFRSINVDVTDRLLIAARAQGCDGFVFVSTASVYAEARDRLGLTETSALARRPANAYVATKLEAERRVLAANAPGFATMAVRPRALVGPHDRTLLPRLVRVARRGWFPLFRGGRALLEITDVRDAADALVAADIHRGAAAGRVFNVSGGAPRMVREVLETAFAALGLAPRLTPLPYPPAALLTGSLERLCAVWPGRPEPPVTVYSLAALAFSQTFDLTNARSALRWKPRRSPEEALARAAEEMARDPM